MSLLAWAMAVGIPPVAVAAALAAELRRRAELVARACHEVRGPLTAAHLALHASARQGEAPPPRLAAIGRELDRAALALDDLAAARRGRAPEDRLEAVEVGALLSGQVATWRAAAGDRLRVVSPPVAGTVRGDRLRLAQAVSNLLANAVEHGRGQIELSARTAGGRLRIEVADEGPGLPAPVPALARRARGGIGRRGRGLAIASAIVARHGGRIVTAPSARGARVIVELPLCADVPAPGLRQSRP
jgi:signal transduction histidine kinase